MTHTTIEDCPELNMRNFTDVDVERLNNWAIEADAEIERLTTERDAYKLDARRYRWLRDRLQVRYERAVAGGLSKAALSMRIGFAFIDSQMRPETGWTNPIYFDDCRESVDRNIDTAIAKEAK